jgi:hypothetical protein
MTSKTKLTFVLATNYMHIFNEGVNFYDIKVNCTYLILEIFFVIYLN